MLTDYQRFFTARPTTTIAQDLLGRLLIYDGPQGRLGGWIVETEAYLGVNDSASHAANGRRSNYSESLYGHPGDIYLYQIRGHFCFDIVAQAAGEPQGILIRGLEPVLHPEIMAANRHQSGPNVSNGPAKLVAALGIHSRDLDGQPMATSPLFVDLAQRQVPAAITTTARIGMNPTGKDSAAPRRFYVTGNPYVSGMKKRAMDLTHHGWQVAAKNDDA